MINYLHSLLHRPERGWDPVPLDHAEKWSAVCTPSPDKVQYIESIVGSLRGKSVLDLGAGPGHHSIAFANAGAQVTWFDISRNYEQIARRRAADSGVQIDFHVGYLEEAATLNRQFDVVFLNVCWYYCMNDRRFARIVYSLVQPGGAGYISSPWGPTGKRLSPRGLVTLLHDRLGIKVGHPFAAHGRIASLFNRFPLEQLHADYRAPFHDIVLFVRSRAEESIQTPA